MAVIDCSPSSWQLTEFVQVWHRLTWQIFSICCSVGSVQEVLCTGLRFTQKHCAFRYRGLMYIDTVAQICNKSNFLMNIVLIQSTVMATSYVNATPPFNSRFRKALSNVILEERQAWSFVVSLGIIQELSCWKL